MHRRVWTFGAAFAVSGAVCLAQAPAQQSQQPGMHMSCTMTDENGKTISLPECANPSSTPRPDTPASKNAAQKFPYPGESTGSTAPDQGAPSSGAQTSGVQGGDTGGSGNPNAGNPNLPASKRFPFPGETPDTPAPSGNAPQSQNQNAGPLRDAGSSGESSSSSSSSSSNDPDAMKDLGPNQETTDPYEADEAAARARAASRRSKREAPAAKPQTADERVAEDLQVASFYSGGGNFRGAYLRARDAVATEAEDPEAHFALAEAARKLGKLDEAQTEYKATLAHDPIPKTKKAAERALKEMSGKG